jgi:tRNA pseudouridine55 synthase
VLFQYKQLASSLKNEALFSKGSELFRFAPMEILLPNSFDSLEEFVLGAILLVDKPYTWTSFDVVNRIKGYVRHNVTIPPNEHGHDQRFKIGHAGTLDPLATGLLVICTGKLTKQIDQIMSGEKEYTGTIRFGQTTASFDLETQVEGEFPTAHLALQMIQECASTMTGEQWQIPPVYSAKQVDGRRAYHAARNGENMIIPAVPVHVGQFQITDFDNNEAHFLIRCSKGTYIRTLAHELGQKLGSGSHLTSLRRTESSPFRIERAVTVDQLLEKLRGF